MRKFSVYFFVGVAILFSALTKASFFHQDPSSQSIWAIMAPNLRLTAELPNPYPETLAESIGWFVKRPVYIHQLAENAEPYIYYIYHETQKRGMPAEIALMPMIESAYDPFACSNTGAVGLWQIMPGTASGFSVDINWWYDGRRDIIDSTNAALNYLAYLHRYFGNWLLAIAAYDSGEGTIENAIKHNRALHKKTDFWSLPTKGNT